MQRNKTQSLSRLEQIHQFLYLLALLFLVQLLLGIFCLKDFASPFSKESLVDLQLLEQKNQFEEQEKQVRALASDTFSRITALQEVSPQPQEENEIRMRLHLLAHFFTGNAVYDPRKEVYTQMALFCQMYFEDKKLVAKKMENTQLFRKQFEECSIGFKDKDQLLNQRKMNQ